MLEQATIFFHIENSTSPFEFDYNVDIEVYSVDVAEVKMDAVVVDDFSANMKRRQELREIEIQKAANRLLIEHPELKEKVDKGDCLSLCGRMLCWDGTEWIRLENNTESPIPNATKPEEPEEKKKENKGIVTQATLFSHQNAAVLGVYDVCVDSSLPVGVVGNEEVTKNIQPMSLQSAVYEAANNLIIEHPEIKEKIAYGDYLHIYGFWFGWKGEWLLLKSDVVPYACLRMVNIKNPELKKVEEEKMVEEKEMAGTDLTTLIYCYVKALIKRDIGDAHVFRSYLVALLFDKYGAMTVNELRILTYKVAREVSIDSKTMFGTVLDYLKNDGIDLYQVAIDLHQTIDEKEKNGGDKWELEY